ncbi:hypothetical protein [Agrococcus casei]|uniref:hypothetical protein n=1 Tax=Agrococcus casei TaxID=343512 RepID=UPI0011783AFF|nr:hypothetical protein [Agrococcus casei]
MSEAIREAAHAEVENKIQAGIRLEEAAHQHAAAIQAESEAEKHANQARREALAAGWTESQLKKLGLAPNRKVTRRHSDGRRSSRVITEQ